MALVKGIEGYLSIKNAANNGYDNVNFVSQWQASLQTQQVDAGPFLNDDGRMYTFTTTKRVNGSFQVTLPLSKQDTHTRLINISNSGDYIGMSLISKGGYTMVIPSAIITGYQLTNAANDQVTVSFDFMDNGGFTVKTQVSGDIPS